MTGERRARRSSNAQPARRLQAAPEPALAGRDPLDIAGRVYLQEIGLRIRALRVRRQVNQAELAELAAVSRVTLGSIERGEHAAGLLTYRKLAHGLGVDVGDLVCEVEAS